MGKAISRCFLLSQPSFSELEVVQKTVVVGHVGEQQGNFIWKAQHVSPFFIHLFRTKATAATAIICYCYLLHIKQRVIQMLYFLCNLDKIFLFYYFGYYFESNFLHFAPSCSATLQCLKNTGKSLIFQVMRHFQVILPQCMPIESLLRLLSLLFGLYPKCILMVQWALDPQLLNCKSMLSSHLKVHFTIF